MIKYCYYINLKNRLDRKEYIEKELNKSVYLKNIYKRFEAIDGTTIHPRYVENDILSDNSIKDVLMDRIDFWGLSMTQGAMGVLLSYIELFKIIKNLDSFCIIFEDDIQIEKNFDKYLEDIIFELPDDFDICYLGYGEKTIEKLKYSKNISIPVGVLTCLPSILVSPKGADVLLKLLKNVEYQIDTFLYTNFSKINVYVSNKKLVKIHNIFNSDIQGIKNCVKRYPKQNYIISTIAVGYDANKNALKLAFDLNYFKQKILIITDNPKLYTEFSNTIVIEYTKKVFSYNHKIMCFREGLKLYDCVVYVDSDTRIFYNDYKSCYTNFLRIIKPGFHPSWDWGKIERIDSGFFESKDVFDRVDGYGSLAMKLCNNLNIDTSKAYHYQEGLLIVSKDSNNEELFLDTWENLATILDDFEIKNNSKRIGVGEGNLIGLAIAKSNITINNTYIANCLGEDLKYNFNNEGQLSDYLNSFPDRKFIDIDNICFLLKKQIDVSFKDLIIDLYYEIYEISENLLILKFKWNKKNNIEFLDHEFKINETVFHFNSENYNEFIFKKYKNIEIYHTYDWYGEKNWVLLDTI